ncbi:MULTISPECIES: hypothetical protein [unclassified Fusibacter]|uniref:hypothetical protein n=1 Tax=unclassified Fusibacter TaxID=2624464 RepID=UPI001012FB08|nr:MULTISPECIES: hypothetical protein [unclassified Fusibacter]MCK8061474.1 YolD-like family protein [Fusibacter sp. A2]NPE23659.1 hypothetical protein [Fusibacter sp. A1]RXV58838.1 hypothetical protein DWB64_17895 [Fusibacter sp. A1]
MNKKINDELKKYEDIIDLPRHVSPKRPQMPVADRAAQFAPFAAVVGHESAIKEAARLTDEKRDLDEMEKTIINDRLREIDERLPNAVEVEITYFQTDALKEGGKYLVKPGTVKKIDVYQREVQLVDGTNIPIEDLLRVTLV